ncbi:MAG: hypothetical protein HQL53_14385 [Magnetococcales bacterium]|nr:hypothetical protein [Magnetococcales bacterium]
MPIILTPEDGQPAFTFPPGLILKDEFNHTRISQKVRITLSGDHVIEESARAAGRILVFEGADCWMKRSDVAVLHGLGETIGLVMDLATNDSQHYRVMFHREKGPALVITPVVPFEDPDADSYYRIGLKLIEIGEA